MLSNIWQWFLTFSYFCVCAPSIWIMLFKLIKNPPSIGHWLLTQEAAGISLCSLPLARRRKWQSTPVLLPGKSHGQRRLVGYSPWGHKESDTTEQLHFHFQRINRININPIEDQAWIFIGRTDAEAPILLPPDARSQFTGKDLDARKDWRQNKRAAEKDG